MLGAEAAPPLLELEPGDCVVSGAVLPAGALRFRGVVVEPVESVLEPALAPLDSREALPAEAPVASELEPERLPPRKPLPESVDEGGDWLDAPAGDWLALPPAEGALWAKAAVAAPAARAATAQSVVMVRISGVLLARPSPFNGQQLAGARSVLAKLINFAA